jgi:hypothetical protein
MNPSMGPVTDPVLDYPSITIPGTETPIPLKLTCFDVWTLLDMGIEVGKVKPGQSSRERMLEDFTVLSVALGHAVTHTPQDLMRMFDFGAYGDVAVVVSRCVVKASAQIMETTRKAKEAAEQATAAAA